MTAVATKPGAAKSWEVETHLNSTRLGTHARTLGLRGSEMWGLQRSSERLVGFLPKLPQLVSFWLRRRTEDFASIPMPTSLHLPLCARYGTGADPKQHGLASSKRPRSFRSLCWVAGHGVVGTERPRHRRWRGCQTGHGTLINCDNLCKLSNSTLLRVGRWPTFSAGL